MVTSSFSAADFSSMQRYFQCGATRSYAFRKEQLKRLLQAVKAYEQRIADALYKDLHKSVEESYMTETGFVYAEISHTLKCLENWMRPKEVSTPLSAFPSSSKVIREPLGISLIIAPWNYPFQLLMVPLVGAIAGGNCAVLKPSELAPHTASVVKALVQEFFPIEYIAVVTGEGHIVVPQLMSDYRFDHVFFTGSIPVGKAIAKQAAEKLIPVTLELGGKSPCIVTEKADLKTAAQRIVWGKFINAGQTCIAPDYLLIHESVKAQFLTYAQSAITAFYGNDAKGSPDYGRIINIKRFKTLQSYLQQGTIIWGGKVDEEKLYISPTLIENIADDSAIMQEEIFGPKLPVITYNNDETALQFVQKHPNPLALYVFSGDRKQQKYFIENIPFGGGCINNTLVHIRNAALPFGGVAGSGMGQYHGRYSFDTFTRPKGVLKTGTWIDPKFKYPPNKGKLKLLKFFLK